MVQVSTGKSQNSALSSLCEVTERMPLTQCQWGAWWRHQMETFSAFLALCAGNSPVTGEFPSQRPVTRSFHVFFDLRLNKRLSKQSWGWWFEMPLRSLWRHCNGKACPWKGADWVLFQEIRCWDKVGSNVSHRLLWKHMKLLIRALTSMLVQLIFVS